MWYVVLLFYQRVVLILRMLHHVLTLFPHNLPLLVELAFSQEAQLTKIVDHRFNAMCLQKEITDVAMASCCPRIQDTWIPSTCEFSMERVSYELSEERCSNYSDGAVMCDWQVSAREERNGNTPD